MKRITCILGTRPEAIKFAPVILALREHPRLRAHVCLTAQHRRMLDQALEMFGVTADCDLDLMRPNQSLASYAAAAIEAIDGYLAAAQPDLVLVQGDTNTVLCASLASFYRHIPVGHIEAGLRTGSFLSPWPEEANRVLTSRLASYHFAPTQAARANLLREGVPDSAITVTGNTVIDALLLARQRVSAQPPVIPGLPDTVLTDRNAPLVLITGHRRESFGEGFRNICLAISELAARFPQAVFVYPVHLNPNVQSPVQTILGQVRRANVFLLEPLSYMPFVALMERAALILTDSGGIQEEAPALGKPVLVMRDTTERPEAVDAGVARLVGTHADRIVAAVAELLTDHQAHASMATGVSPFGDGRAALRILDVIDCALSHTKDAAVVSPAGRGVLARPPAKHA